VKGTTSPTHSWGLVVLCPSLGFTNEWVRPIEVEMTKWTTQIPTRAEFAAQFRKCPELIVMWGVLDGRYGPQSLRTVLDTYSQVFIHNRREGWCALVERRGRRGFAILPQRSRQP
jgi:hypothetical protein